MGKAWKSWSFLSIATIRCPGARPSRPGQADWPLQLGGPGLPRGSRRAGGRNQPHCSDERDYHLPEADWLSSPRVIRARRQDCRKTPALAAAHAPGNGHASPAVAKPLDCGVGPSMPAAGRSLAHLSAGGQDLGLGNYRWRLGWRLTYTTVLKFMGKVAPHLAISGNVDGAPG